MGAYDNMFSNASTFKVELDEWRVCLQCLIEKTEVRSWLAARSLEMPHLSRWSFWMVRGILPREIQCLLLTLKSSVEVHLPS